jgi:hypothetical protein
MVCNKTTTKRATCGAGIAYPSRAPEFILILVGFVLSEKGQTTIYKTLHRKLMIEDTKRVRSRISMDRQQNSETKKDKQ